jgi:hypothetical protein
MYCARIIRATGVIFYRSEVTLLRLLRRVNIIASVVLHNFLTPNIFYYMNQQCSSTRGINKRKNI